MSRNGDTRSMPLMERYAVQPLGGGYGIYDKVEQKFLEETYSGRGAMQKADRAWRDLVGSP